MLPHWVIDVFERRGWTEIPCEWADFLFAGPNGENVEIYVFENNPSVRVLFADPEAYGDDLMVYRNFFARNPEEMILNLEAVTALYEW